VLLSYTYDPSRNETSVTGNLSSAGITTLSYDLDERVTTVATSYGGTAGPVVTYSYDAASRLTSSTGTIGTDGTAVSTSISYDAANRETTIVDDVTTYTSGGGFGGSTSPLATYVYTYDEANRVTSETDAEGTASFAYDSANELTTVTGSRSESYTYDLNGNRTGTGYSTTVMNETSTSPGTTYTYDNAGNMISGKTGSTITTYTYDYNNRLRDVTQGGTVIATYVYDALNRRIGIDDNGTQTWTVYDGTNPYADFNGSGTLEERYVYGPGVVNGAIVDQILARTSSGGTTAWYLTDKLGSVRDIVGSASGGELDHIVYDSFGNILTETNASNGDRFKFAGMEYDPTTGQYYDRARDYDSTTGRFMSLDPKGFAAGDVDLYRYVHNGPTDGTDPTGLEQANQPQGNQEPADLLQAQAAPPPDPLKPTPAPPLPDLPPDVFGPSPEPKSMIDKEIDPGIVITPPDIGDEGIDPIGERDAALTLMRDTIMGEVEHRAKENAYFRELLIKSKSQDVQMRAAEELTANEALMKTLIDLAETIDIIRTSPRPPPNDA